MAGSNHRMKSEEVRKKKAALLKRQDNRCHWCGREFTEQMLPTLDHLKRHADGGKNHLNNLVAACYPCNHRRALNGQ